MSPNGKGAAEKPTGPCSLCGCATSPSWRRIPKSYGEAGGQSSCNACYVFVLKRHKEDEDSVPSALDACRACKRTKSAVQTGAASQGEDSAGQGQAAIPGTPASGNESLLLAAAAAAATPAAQASLAACQPAVLTSSTPGSSSHMLTVAAAAFRPAAHACGASSASHMLAAGAATYTAATRGGGSRGHSLLPPAASSPVLSGQQQQQQQQQQQPPPMQQQRRPSPTQQQQLQAHQPRASPLKRPHQPRSSPMQQQQQPFRMQLRSTQPSQAGAQLTDRPLSPPSIGQPHPVQPCPAVQPPALPDTASPCAAQPYLAAEQSAPLQFSPPHPAALPVERSSAALSPELQALQEAVWQLALSSQPAQVAFEDACRLTGARSELLGMLPALWLLRPGTGNYPQPVGVLLLSVWLPPPSLPPDAQNVLLRTGTGLEQTLRLLAHCPHTGRLLQQRDWLQGDEGFLYAHPFKHVPTWDSSEGWKLLFPEPASDTTQARLFTEVVRRFGSAPPAAAPPVSFTITGGSSAQLQGDASRSSSAPTGAGEHHLRPQLQLQLQLQQAPQLLPTPFASQQAQHQRAGHAGSTAARLLRSPGAALQQGPWDGQAAALSPPALRQQGSGQQLAGTLHSPGPLLQAQPQFGAPDRQALTHTSPSAQQQQAGQVSRLPSADTAAFQRLAQSLQWPEQPPAAPASHAMQPRPALAQPPQQAQQAAFASGSDGRSGSLPPPLVGIPLDLLVAGEPRLSEPRLTADLIDRWQSDLLDEEFLNWMIALDMNMGPGGPAGGTV